MNPAPSIRAFLALTLPAEVQQRLHALGDSLRSDNVEASWEPSEKLHITIRFLGTLSQESLRTVTSRMEPIASSMCPFDVVFTHIGAFPHASNPRVIWVGAHKNDALMKMMRDVEAECRRTGLAPEERQPHPHATLARIKRQHSNPSLTALLKSITFDPILIRASELTLMKSVLHQRGSTYSTLMSFPFIRSRSSHE